MALKKCICQKCYQYHEAKWDVGLDVEWENGFTNCPLSAVPVEHHGKVLDDGSAAQKMIAAIFGSCVSIREVPDWCTFADEHDEEIGNE